MVFLSNVIWVIARLLSKWQIQPGAGGAWPPVGGLTIFFRQYINIITKPTA